MNKSNTPIDPASTADNFYEIFNQLDKEEKFFLQITALLDSDITREELFRVLKALFKAPGSGYKWSDIKAEEYHQKLLELELIDNRNHCHPMILETAARRPLKKSALDLCKQLIRSSYIDNNSQNEDAANQCSRVLRDFRLDLFSHDFGNLQKYLPILHQADYDPKFRHPYAALTLYPFYREWFLNLPLPFQFAALDDSFTHSLEDLTATPELDRFLIEQFPPQEASNRPFILPYSHKLLLSGRISELEQLYNQQSHIFNGSGLKGALSALKGNLAQAALEFDEDLKVSHNLNPDKTACFDAPIALFYTLTAGHIQTATDWSKVAITLNVGEQEYAYNPFTRDLFYLAEALLHFFRGFTDAALQSLKKIEKRPVKSIFTMLNNLISYWITGGIDQSERIKLKSVYEYAAQNNFPWIVLESAQLLSISSSCDEEFPSLNQEPMLKAFAPAINFEPAWRRTLNAIRQVTPNPNQLITNREVEIGSRLAWYLEPTHNSSQVQITPKIQRLNSDNSWTTGRNLAFERILNGDEFPFFSPQDHRICKAIRKSYNRDNGEKTVDLGPILKALTGHPLIYRNDRPLIPVTLTAGEVAIIISQVESDKPSFKIYLEPNLHDQECICLNPTESRFVYYRNRAELKNINRLLGENGLTLPIEAKNDIILTIKDLATTLPILSDLDPELDEQNIHSDNSESCDLEKNKSNLYLQIFPSGRGLLFELKVKPIGASGPTLSPGIGPKHLLATLNGKINSVKRDLELETERTQRLFLACPVFDNIYLKKSWQIDNLEDCLETLVLIQDFQSELKLDENSEWLICEWPAGQKLSLKKRVQGSAFKIRVESQQDWFKIEGELKIDENEVISLKELLKQNKSASGRFLKLADGEFISLTNKLREHLLELSLYLQDDENSDELTFHRGMMSGMADSLNSFNNVQYDTIWQKQMKRFREAEKFSPQLPETLQTELRSYQVEGFKWLSRLAHLGFGGCLADDMGLGKTVQTLTLILTRAQNGPTLVVAPTSVCGNWLKESKRFAPDLNPILFGGPQRPETIAGLKPFDLLICSYTMLQQEQKLMAGLEWEIIVLDEAQAIKNMNTKRSQAAMSLQGKFRLITTGTPMENHLGELWNLFNFINPGLLGSLKQFTRRFALPIEHENNLDARETLRKLIKPYILRRNKSQVLKELPERTEILLEVKMSEAERNFYEAVRRQAIDRLEEASDKKSGKTSPSIQVLAELTRLRLAACNPRLVAPASTIESAKLELFGRVIDDLLAGDHQALIFSQFVKHLNLIREYLDSKKISYRYLDGSTPKTKREDEINAFQEGEADLFLISLKAGGLGLNLTAADYVLHLDPWWNPAIEDQASDRAHRIGQTRPVTVYRLITKSSIEEKIVRLHQEKRNLADQILSASDQSARFSTHELLELIKTG